MPSERATGRQWRSVGGNVASKVQESVNRYAEEAWRAHGVTVQIRVGLNSGEVVVRAIGNDLHMDYTAVGETTHLAARMEQAARPGTVLMAPATRNLVEGFVAVRDGHVGHHGVASSRSRSTSRIGGSPKCRLYSRLKCEGSS